MRVNIENAILSTFLYANDTTPNLGWIFKLETSIFTSPFRKRIAQKINEVEDGAYGFLAYEIEESVTGTNFQTDFMDILTQTPLSIVKKYHDKLVKEDMMEVAL